MSVRIQGGQGMPRAAFTPFETTKPNQPQVSAQQTYLARVAQDSFEATPSTEKKNDPQQDVEKRLKAAKTRTELIQTMDEVLDELNKRTSGAKYAGQLSLAWLKNDGRINTLPLDELKEKFVGIARFAPYKAKMRRAWFQQLLEQAQNMYKNFSP